MSLAGSDSEETSDEEYVPGEEASSEVDEDEDEEDEEEEAASEQPESRESAEQRKKHEEDLWAAFKSDVGRAPARPTAEPNSTANSTANATASKANSTANATASKADSTANATASKADSTANANASKADSELKTNSKSNGTALQTNSTSNGTASKAVLSASAESKASAPTREFDFAGETVTVPTSGTTSKRPAGGVAGLLDRLKKKPKLSTLEKSRLDWEGFKESQGISEELSAHNRGRGGFLERRAFLERADVRQFEIERQCRMATRDKK